MINFDDIVMFEKNLRVINLYIKDEDIIKFYENFDDLKKCLFFNFFMIYR